MIYTHCKRCGKPLKTPKSMRRGYGDECFKKKLHKFEVCTYAVSGENDTTNSVENNPEEYRITKCDF